MKLSAVRLSEVGHFRSGVSLEGLSGGLDVVPGPNEMGKSTIFRAIETVFQTPYSGTAAAVQELMPVQGGAPLIEVEFELGGTRWRLRKRYLAQKLAELVDLDRKTLLRGADAENRLVELVAGRLGRKRMLDLIWVGQTRSLALPDDKKGEIAKDLGRLIEDEIADAAGDGMARRVREAATKALNELVKPANRQRARVGKPYKAALDARDLAMAAYDKAVSDGQAASRRLGDVQRAQAQLAELSAPDAAAAREASLSALRQAMDEAVRAEEKLQRATLVVEARQTVQGQARGRLQQLTDGTREVEQLRAALAATAEALATAGHDVERGDVERERRQLCQVEARRRAVELQALLEAHDRFERHQAAMAKVDELTRRLDGARTASLRMAELDRSIASEPVDERAVAELRRALVEIEKLDAQLGAALPKVRIDYATGGAGRIRVSGLPVAESGEVAAAPTLTLDIDGVGRITVSAPSAAAETLVARLAAARHGFDERLRASNATTIAEAEARLEIRQRLAAERLTLVARLGALAPDGLQALERTIELSRVGIDPTSADLASPTPTPTLTRAQIAEELVTVRATLVELEDGLAKTQAALLDASKRQSRLASEHEGLTVRLSRLEATLPPAEETATEIAARQDALAKADGELNAAVLERAAWSAGVLAPPAFSRLKADLAAAASAEQRIRQQRQQLALDIKGLESALARDRQDGVEAIEVEARATLDAAEARVARFKREVDELELLERLLAAEASAARASELKPVVDRLQEYARFVFPDARLELGDMLAVSGLSRQGISLSDGRLSGGTSELIAILVRLAYARLLADRGEALPLVLDDALVYADAERFASMVSALEAAARHHQVIMLTCHAERIAALGVRPKINTVPLGAWSPGETALVA